MIRRSRQRGFTLIESAMAIVIIGVGILAVMELLAAGTAANGQSAQLTTGVNLARHIQELAISLPYTDPHDPAWGPESGETSIAAYDDLDDLNGATFSPPIDVHRSQLGDMTGWAQAVSVEGIDPDNLDGPGVAALSDALRITVTITHNGDHVCDTTWVVCRL